MRLRGSKGWHTGVYPRVKRELDTSDDEPSPPREGPSAATPDPELADQEERGEQREGRGCKETGDKVYAGEAPRATPAPPVPPAGSERSPRSSASYYPMEIASPHLTIPYNGVLSDTSVESHGPAHDSSKPSAYQPTVQQGAATVVNSSSPTLASAAVSQGASAEEVPGVPAPSPAGSAEPQPMEVVASPASSNGRISSEPSDALPAPAPSASNFRRNIGLPALPEACPDGKLSSYVVNGIFFFFCINSLNILLYVAIILGTMLGTASILLLPLKKHPTLIASCPFPPPPKKKRASSSEGDL